VHNVNVHGGRAARMAAAAIALIGVTAGCGVAQSASGKGPHLTVAAQGRLDQRSRASEYAMRLLSDLRLPAGAHRTLPRPLGNVVDLRAFYTLRWPVARVSTFLATHTPASLRPGNAGHTPAAHHRRIPPRTR
jgi:hypothetical protein